MSDQNGIMLPIFEGSSLNGLPPFEQDLSYPTHILPPLMRTYLHEAYKWKGYRHEFFAPSLLTVMGIAAGSGVFLSCWSDEGRATMNPIAVASPGMAKSAPVQDAMAFLMEKDAERIADFTERWHGYEIELEDAKAVLREARKAKDGINKKADMAAAKDRIKELQEEKPILEQLYVTDFTEEGLIAALVDNEKGMVIYDDEIAGLFLNLGRYSGGKGGAQLLLKLADGRGVKVIRKGDRIPTQIKSTFVSQIGTTQPETVLEMASKLGPNNGLTARYDWIFAAADELPPHRDGRIANEATEGHAEATERLFALRDHGPIEVRPKEKDVALIRAFQNNDMVHLWEGQEDEMERGMTSKMRNRVYSYTLALHLAHWAYDGTTPEPDPYLPTSIVKGGIALAEYHLKGNLRMAQLLRAGSAKTSWEKAKRAAEAYAMLKGCEKVTQTSVAELYGVTQPTLSRTYQTLFKKESSE